MTTPTQTKVPLLEWTDNPEANRLIAENPLALLIGFCLDQQVPIEWAFLGPLTMQKRLGTLDAGKLARLDPEKFQTAFSTPPAVHRFPRSMAERVQGICRIVADEYGGEAANLWLGAADGKELSRRLGQLPGFGAAKSRIVVGVLAKHFAIKPKGWEAEAPDWPTLAEVHTVEERKLYQAQKRAHKAALKAQRSG